MTIQVGEVLHGRYRIVKLLNQGGFGAIYRVWDLNLGRPCALKENLDTTVEAQRQFEREAKILANLEHPNLPRVTDYFFIPNQGQYLVMDFVDGQDLQEMLEAKGQPLDEEKISPWINQVCAALAYLHEQNPPVIHRDIKPANIIITPGGRAMLVDFGIAKIFDPQLKTTLGARAVTPGFSPHEQYGQDITDIRTDIYSLGATIYTLLTGEEPPESIRRVVKDPLAPANQRNPRISSHFAAGLQRAMQIDPERRYQTVEEFRDALFGDRSAPTGGSKLSSKSRVSSARSGTFKKPVVSPWLWVVLLSALFIIALTFIRPGRRSSLAPVAPTPTTSLLSETQSVPEGLVTMTPAESPAPLTASPEPTPQVYVVQTGDTCSGIAFRYGTTVSTIIALNDLDEVCNIFVGQELLILTKRTIEDETGAVPIAPVSTEIASNDGMTMVYVPAGEFPMGAAEEDSVANDDEKPLHRVTLDSFWIDRYEITNAMYALCVGAGACKEPAQRGSDTRLFYYGDARYGDYPVIHVTWTDAQAYCAWVERRLPSEAEWEKAARGPLGDTFPWGDEDPTPSLLNYNNHIGDTTSVGSFPQGSSPYGVLDMAGNVTEWVADWYDPYYYEFSPVRNPLGAQSGEFRVLRGGSWFSPMAAVRASFRHRNAAGQSNSSTGFRCALGR